jgi:hypothetical protein
MKLKSVIISVILVLTLLTPAFVFYARSPVLLLSDATFSSLYGVNRCRIEVVRSSLALFRRLKLITIADDAGEDIILYALASASKKPFSVIFPLRFARTAKTYREKNPQIPVIILEGRYSAGQVSFALSKTEKEDFYVYNTDIEADFTLAARASLLLIGEQKGKIVVFYENHIQKAAKDAYQKVIKTVEKPPDVRYYTNLNQNSRFSELTSVIIAGSGGEYFDKFSGTPVIFYTWIDPGLVPAEVVMVLDDSPLTQAVQAVRMAVGETKTGTIPSKPIIISRGSAFPEKARELKSLGKKIEKKSLDGLTNNQQTNIIISKD